MLSTLLEHPCSTICQCSVGKHRVPRYFECFLASRTEADLHAISGESQFSNLGPFRGVNRSGREADDGVRRRRERTENEYSPSTILLDKRYQLEDPFPCHRSISSLSIL